jgi:hypothetical protein
MEQATDENVAPLPQGNYRTASQLSWLGILLAGGIYGIIIGGNEPIFGFIAGIVIAAMFSLPVIVTIGVIVWAFWLNRFQISIAILVGACTGMGSSALITTSGFSGSATAMILLAGLLGGAGGGFVAFLYWSSHDRRPQIGRNNGAPAWQYSLRDLFLRFTVLSVLVAAWSLAIALIAKSTSP